MNYWPISDGTMNDIIGGMNMQQGNFTTFAADRFGNANSALNLNGGYTFVPPGVYFNSEFTISAWVYPDTVGSWARLIDFGNGQYDNNVAFAFSCNIYLVPTLCMSDSSIAVFRTISSVNYFEKIWHFLTASFDGINARMYLDGKLTQTFLSNVTQINVTRSKNYIGKSNFDWDGNSSSLVDDLRIYNRCLNDIEIQNLMMNTV